MTSRLASQHGTLRAGVIGLGVGEQHIHGFQADPRCEVVALCDVDEGKLKEVGERFPGVSLTSSPEGLLSDPDIDVVSIASYDDSHHNQVVSALEHGKHVFVEKPVCLTWPELESISESLRVRPQLKLSSNLLLRRAPRFLQLNQRIQAGDLGEIFYWEGDYDYGRLEKITQGWRGRTQNYSVVHGGAIHLIDLVLWLSGERVVEVVAYGNQFSSQMTQFSGHDMVVSLLKLANGSVAKITANFGSVTPHHHKVSAYGTKGTFSQNHVSAAYLWSRNKAVPPEQVTSEYPDVAKGTLITSFVGSILDGTELDIPASEVFSAMAVSLSIVDSLSLGRPVRINNEDW